MTERTEGYKRHRRGVYSRLGKLAQASNEKDAALTARNAEIKRLNERIKALDHLANEWADCATNGLQWIRNIREGISTFEDAELAMVSGIAHCQDTRAK